jgi:hypothetical protein
MKAIQVLILLTSVSNIFGFVSGVKLFKPNLYIKKEIVFKDDDTDNETWDDGEVAWDFDSIIDPENVTEVVFVKRQKLVENSEREKMWSLVEELRMQGAISGFLNIAYYNTAVSDSIVNDIQSFHIKPNMNFENIVIYNFNNEIDIILTLLTIYVYKKYKESRIMEFIRYWEEKYKGNYYFSEYRNIRKISASLALISIIIFCKSVQSAS